MVNIYKKCTMVYLFRGFNSLVLIIYKRVFCFNAIQSIKKRIHILVPGDEL